MRAGSQHERVAMCARHGVFLTRYNIGSGAVITTMSESNTRSSVRNAVASHSRCFACLEGDRSKLSRKADMAGPRRGREGLALACAVYNMIGGTFRLNSKIDKGKSAPRSVGTWYFLKACLPCLRDSMRNSRVFESAEARSDSTSRLQGTCMVCFDANAKLVYGQDEAAPALALVKV
jgi:hypothetical protein